MISQEYYDKMFHAFEAHKVYNMHYVVIEETTSSGFLYYLVIPRETWAINKERYGGYCNVFSTAEGSITYGLES